MKYLKETIVSILVFMLVSCQTHPTQNTKCRFIVTFVCNDPKFGVIKSQNPNNPFEKDMMEYLITGRAVNLGGSGGDIINAIKGSNDACERVTMLDQISREGQKPFARTLANDVCSGLGEFLNEKIHSVSTR
ncbi:MAG: hypothetical protein ACHQYP_10365 [Nitrospiria bacterium]